MKKSVNPLINIYIDTNVLLNYLTGQDADITAMRYIFSQRRKENLFTSSLALVQTVTQLQKGNKQNGRKPYDSTKAGRLIAELMKKITVLELTDEDITNGINLAKKDLEDSIHFAISKKAECKAVITNNIKDFSCFTEIKALSPTKLSVIKQRIN